MTPDQICEHLDLLSKKDNVDVEALFDENQNFKTSVFKGNIDQFNVSNTRALGIRVIRKGREGASYTESYEKEDVDLAYQSALQQTELVEKDYEPQFVAGVKKSPNLDFYSESLAQTKEEEKLAVAKKMEEIALKYDSRVSSLPYNSYVDVNSSRRIFNTKGTDVSYKSNSCFLFTYVLAKEGDKNAMHWSSDVKKSLKSLDVQGVAETAAEQALKKLSAITPESGMYPVLFNNKVAGSMLDLVVEHFSLAAVDRKSSLLTGKLGDVVLSKKLTLVDDPFFAGALRSRPFDAEGSPSQETVLVEAGVAKNFISNSVLAKKHKLPNTSHAQRSAKTGLGVAASNVVIKPGTSSFEELLKVYPKVLVVDELKGLAGVNHISGNFSIPAEGCFYENGQLTQTLKDFVISGQIFELFNKVVEVGNDPILNPHSECITPSILISEISVAGK